MQVQTVKAERSAVGVFADGQQVEAITLRAPGGVSARVLTLGATLQMLEAPDRDGRAADITLGYADVAEYSGKRPAFWGQTVGRYANRISSGRFVLDNVEHRLPINDNGHSHHGGADGFDRRNWTVERIEEGPVAAVTLSLLSPAGDQGYPGSLNALAIYSLNTQGCLAIDYRATTDAPTIVNMTNHALFDLGGDHGEGVRGHELRIEASRFLPVDRTLIPTGTILPVAGTAFDFTRSRSIDDRLRDGTDPQVLYARGWDHNFVLDKGMTTLPELAARVLHRASGRVLEVLTTEPGLQLYSGNFLDGTVPGKNGKLYRQGDGFALEPQRFPDTPNQPHFGSARLDPGGVYHHRMIYRVSTMD